MGKLKQMVKRREQVNMRNIAPWKSMVPKKKRKFYIKEYAFIGSSRTRLAKNRIK